MAQKGHPETLDIIRTKKQAVAKGRAGGLANKGKPRWYMRKWCNKTCVYWDRCPVITVSMQQIPDEKRRRPCFIKTKSQEIQNFFRSLFEEGEEGLVKIALDLYFWLLLKTGADPKVKELRDAIHTTLELKRGIYGEKMEHKHSGTITSRQEIIADPEVLKAANELSRKLANARAVRSESQ